MDEEQTRVIVIGDDLSSNVANRLRDELNRRGLRHVLIVAAGLLVVDERAGPTRDDFTRMLVKAEDFPVILGATLLERSEAPPLPPYYQRYNAVSRMAESNLAALYSHAAKWGSGAHNAGHRSRENRHAERQRNYLAFQKH